jgi:hypothetical protein
MPAPKLADIFSPLAAYEPKSHRFLIVDTARYRYLQVWVAAGDLWAAMNTIDADAKTSRGFLIIGRSRQ